METEGLIDDVVELTELDGVIGGLDRHLASASLSDEAFIYEQKLRGRRGDMVSA